MTVIQAAPFFLLLVAGYAAVRFRYVSESVGGGLMQFVFLVAVPIYVFRTMLRTSLLDGKLENVIEMLLLYFGAAAVVMAVAVVVGRTVLRTDSNGQEAMAAASSHSNVVLLGIPAAFILLGTKSVSPMMLLVGLHGAAMALLVLGLQKALGKKGGSPSKVLIDIVKNPIFIACVAGIIGHKAGLRIPREIDGTLRMLPALAVPCALFGFGGWLAHCKLDKVGERMQFEISIAAMKLVLHPFLIWLVVKQFKLVYIPTSWLWMIMILAAMPAGIEIAIQGKRVGGKVSDATILISSLIAIGTVIGGINLLR